MAAQSVIKGETQKVKKLDSGSRLAWLQYIHTTTKKGILGCVCVFSSCLLGLVRLLFSGTDLQVWMKLCFEIKAREVFNWDYIILEFEKHEWVNDINRIKLGTPLTFSWINNKWAWIGGWRHQLYYRSVGPVQYVGSRNEKWIAALCTQFPIRLLAFYAEWFVWKLYIFFFRT